MDDSSNQADAPAPTLELLKTTKIDIMRLDGIERELVLCPRCSTYFERALKLAWAELTKIVLTEQEVTEEADTVAESEV